MADNLRLRNTASGARQRRHGFVSGAILGQRRLGQKPNGTTSSGAVGPLMC